MTKRFVVFLGLMALATVAFAQSIPTSTLTGKVRADGAAVPGVTVTVTSPNLQGSRTTVTTQTGDYILPLLPPGSYTVKFELSGFAPLTKKVSLGAANTERLEGDMRPAAVAEAITVTAETPVTAPVESTQLASNFKQDMIEALPMDRTIRSVTLLTPGVNNNGPSGGNIMISGAMSYDSIYLVNGAIV